MNARAGGWTIGVAVLVSIYSLRAAPPPATAEVTDVDFLLVPHTITLSDVEHCGSYTTGTVLFNAGTVFELGQDNPVDSSQLVVAKKIEFACADLGIVANRITIKETSGHPPPPHLTNMLGNFPLADIIQSLITHPYGDRFADVEGDPDTENSVAFQRLLNPFSTGKCQVVPAKLVRCEFAYSDALSNLLIRRVQACAAWTGLIRDLEPSNLPGKVFTDPRHQIRLRLWNSPPVSTITVEAY